jgi:Cd2+/Zn2+-exporting ATPase
MSHVPYEPANELESFHYEEGSYAGELRVYTVEHMDCANCAAKVEAILNQLPTVEAAVLTYATKQLRVWAQEPERALSDIRAAVEREEPEWEVLTQTSAAPEEEEEENDLPVILASAAALLAVLLLPGVFTGGWVEPLRLALCLGGWLLSGFPVLKTAGKNLLRGQIFDENFLMSVATLGAFVIGEYPEALGVMLFYRIGEAFEDRAVERSRSSIQAALDLRPETVTLVTGEQERVIPADAAQVGDLIRVRPGDRIPLDGVVRTGESQVDTSAVTGEPVPVAVGPGKKVVSGCLNSTGVLTVEVEAELSESMVSRILDSVENAAARKPRIDRFITRFAHYYTPVVVGLAALTAVVPSLVTGDWAYWGKTACSFLVISCPCALVLSVPLAFYAGIGAASREKILFKGGSALEALRDVKVAVLDKTGTLTQGSFEVTSVEPVPGLTAEELLLRAAACERHSTHPIALSILAAVDGQPLPALENIRELAGRGQAAPGGNRFARDRHQPLQNGSVAEPVREGSKNRVGSTASPVIEYAGRGVSAGPWLCGNAALLREQGVEIPALRPVPGATQVLLAREGAYVGRILISDQVKEGAAEAVAKLRRMGLATVMLTGDGEESANAVAEQVGVDAVRARLLPQEKLSALEELRQQYGPVLFTGDGINDAPVLSGADVGAAMGSGADAAIEAADVVFLTSDPEAVPRAVELARQVNGVARQNVAFALAVKALVLVLGMCHLANLWLAVFADTGVAMLCIINSIRILSLRRPKGTL